MVPAGADGPDGWLVRRASVVDRDVHVRGQLVDGRHYCLFCTIQAAVDVAVPGDTILGPPWL